MCRVDQRIHAGRPFDANAAVSLSPCFERDVDDAARPLDARGADESRAGIEHRSHQHDRIRHHQHAAHVHAIDLQRVVAFARDAHRLLARDVVGEIAVEHLVDRRPAVAERRKKREQHVAALGELEPAVLEVVDAPQLVGGQVLLRRGGLAGDAAAAELVGVLRVAGQRDVPDAAYPLEATKRRGGAFDEAPRGRLLRRTPANATADQRHRRRPQQSRMRSLRRLSDLGRTALKVVALREVLRAELLHALDARASPS